MISKTCRTCHQVKPLEYFTKHKMSKGGHVNHCKPCLAYKARQDREADKEKFREVSRRSKRKTYNSGKETSKKREEYAKDPLKFNSRSKRYYQKHKESRKESVKKYLQTNPHKRTHFSALRRAAKNNATPPWLHKEHRQEISNLYKLARKLNKVCQQELEVDHIVPLKGQNVCGLHVPWNLQLLHKDLNRSKSNTKWPDMWPKEIQDDK